MTYDDRLGFNYYDNLGYDFESHIEAKEFYGPFQNYDDDGKPVL